VAISTFQKERKIMKKNLLRKLPSIDVLINTEEAKELIEEYSHNLIVEVSRNVLKELRTEIQKNEKNVSDEENLSSENILKRIENHLKEKFSPSLCKAINATGVILHTGLGRAVLSREAKDLVNSIIEGYCTLEIDIESGRRGHRDVHLNNLFCELTGAEAATVVNNNAAATLLILNTLAKGKEVIVSRGQLVEIGGSFRMPEVMEASGAILKEVGTTNKTHLKDYTSAINENTRAIMRVHHSNYRIVGFADEPAIEELAELAKEHNLPLIDDLGSGALVDLNEFGLETEPMVKNSIKAGIDVACFSGDKLIGGPQAGVIVGKALIVEKIRKNPLARTVRIGKLTIACMEATLRLFLNQKKLNQKHPLYKTLSLSQEELEKRAKKVHKKLRALIADEIDISLIEGLSQVGGGSVPLETLPTKLLRVKSNALSAEELAKKLRLDSPPIFARVHKGAVLFDFRTIQEDEDSLIAEALMKLLKSD